MVKKQFSVRRASSMAQASNAQQNPKNASEVVKFSRAKIEFQILSLQSELELLNEFSAMSDNEKCTTLFGLLDQNNSGLLSVEELANGLRTIRGTTELEESVSKALDELNAMDTVQNGQLSSTEFQTLVNVILPVIGCNLQELCDMIVLKVLFSENVGNVLLVEQELEVVVQEEDDPKDELADEDKASLRRAMKDQRMKVLFRLFDTKEDGVCDFREVVVGLYKLMDGIDEASHAAVTALLLLDEKETRELKYPDFARLMLSVVASLPEHVTFSDVADMLTRSASSAADVPDKYILDKFTMDTTSKLLLNITDDLEYLALGVIEMAKLEKLFHMMDLSRDNRISTKELALGLRKFQITTGMATTVDEATQVMKEFDKDADGRLSPVEFAKFMVNFAKSAGSKLLDLVDFMIVVSALQENTEAENIYMRDIGKDPEINYWYG